jgi:hypothetical protein
MHTIIALTLVSPPLAKDPADWANAGEASPTAKRPIEESMVVVVVRRYR